MRQRYLPIRLLRLPQTHWTHRDRCDASGTTVVNLSLVGRSRAARKNIFTKLVCSIKIITHLIPNIRCFLPLVNQTGLVTIQRPLRIHASHGDSLLGVQLDKTLLKQHACCGFPTKLWAGYQYSTRTHHLTLNLAFYQPFVIHIPYIFNFQFLIFSI